MRLIALSLTRRFHSKMVRLEVGQREFFGNLANEFPFQNGAIRSYTYTSESGASLRFPFQTGAIRSWERAGQELLLSGFHSKLVRLEGFGGHSPAFAYVGFHSKLVRLEVTKSTCQCFCIGMFPFQTGAIRSVSSKVDLSGEQYMFPFQTGAIRRSSNLFTSAFRIPFPFQTGAIRSIVLKGCSEPRQRVSIPNWCD